MVQYRPSILELLGPHYEYWILMCSISIYDRHTWYNFNANYGIILVYCNIHSSHNPALPFLFVWYHAVKCIHDINAYHKENHVFITATAIKLNQQKTNFIDKLMSNQIAFNLIIFLYFKKGAGQLTHLLLMLHIWVSKMGQHWFIYWLVPCSAPSHHLNRCWLIVNWTHENKFQWKWNQNSIIFIQENAF